jgi:hypothetical protein
MRLLGAEHPRALSCAAEIASCLSGQGNLKYAKAEQIHREVPMLARAVDKRVLGPEQPETLMSAANLAASSWSKGSMLRRSRSTGARGVRPGSSESPCVQRRALRSARSPGEHHGRRRRTKFPRLSSRKGPYCPNWKRRLLDEPRDMCRALSLTLPGPGPWAPATPSAPIIPNSPS